jgi:cysteine-rich repeat protein
VKYLKNIVVFILLLIPSQSLSRDSTSPNFIVDQNKPIVKFNFINSLSASNIITFDEFSLYAQITNQYADRGIEFGGSGPFIAEDGASATSPVLSGSPLFQGDITGKFVDPETGESAVVQSFTFDAGYFDEIGSTRIEWFDPNGKKIDQRINSTFGIERLTINGGNIASWRISIIENEPAGYAIDNVSFIPIGPSVIFREHSGDTKQGTWGFEKDEIPGFDHTAFQMDNLVYESHPGYRIGQYISADGKESINITQINGVQSQFTRNTFKHDSINNYTSVVNIDEIPIDSILASKMRDAINTVNGSKFLFIDYTLDGLSTTLSPNSQKGGGGEFTCVGLVEWASEKSNHNNGQGFIKNNFEYITVPDPRSSSLPIKYIDLPLLSPQLLNYAMKGSNLLQSANQWLQGLLDPVDFVVKDPLGRRLGFTQQTGIIEEIPNAFYGGNGKIEQFLIPNPIPGTYTIELIGVNDEMFMGVGTSDDSHSFKKYLSTGETKVEQIIVTPKAGTGGDVDRDGDIDNDDIQVLQAQLNRFTNGLGHPGDIDGDGLLSNKDLQLLTQLVDILNNTLPICGDGIIEETEECDDGNLLSGDGCSAACVAECVPTRELCDKIDNDCDGQIDEDHVCSVPGDLNFDGIIDRYDVAIVTANRNKLANVYPECDLDGDGKITVLDARKLSTICTYTNCASN